MTTWMTSDEKKKESEKTMCFISKLNFTSNEIKKSERKNVKINSNKFESIIRKSNCLSFEAYSEGIFEKRQNWNKNYSGNLLLDMILFSFFKEKCEESNFRKRGIINMFVGRLPCESFWFFRIQFTKKQWDVSKNNEEKILERIYVLEYICENIFFSGYCHR